MDSPASYSHWGFILISVPNLILIGLMIVLFVIALVVHQLPPFNSASNADLLVVGMMGILTLLLLLVPFIPGLRDIPRWVPIYRLIWRRYYRRETGS